MTGAMGLSLEAEGLTFAYGDVKALDGFSLTVRQGGIVGMVGPNGAGKSTLVRVVSGVARPQEGQIRLGGGDLEGMSALEVARRVAVAPQQVPVLLGHQLKITAGISMQMR